MSLRYANVYGPRQNPHGEAGVVAIFTERLRAGQPLRVNAMDTLGDHGCIRDYVYVGDVAQANLAAARGQTPRLLNVGTGTETTTRQLAEQLAAALKVPVDLLSASPRSSDLKRSVLNSDRFRSVLGEPLALSAGLHRTADWARSRS